MRPALQRVLQRGGPICRYLRNSSEAASAPLLVRPVTVPDAKGPTARTLRAVPLPVSRVQVQAVCQGNSTTAVSGRTGGVFSSF